MKKIIVMFFLSLAFLPWGLSGGVYAQEHENLQGYENPQLIAYADWVVAHKDDADVVLVDVRSPGNYAGGHIPGAINIYWKMFRDKKGVFVGVSKAEEILGKKGIDNSKEVVVYGDRGGAISSYLFWMLEYMRHERVINFDGGMEVWIAEGRKLSKTIKDLPPAVYKAVGVREDLLVKNKWIFG